MPAVAALLVNPDAKIRKETMDRIIEQAEEISAWHMPLALRADLSARAIRRIGGFVGASILERLAARNDLSDATRIHLNRELRARLAEAPIEAGRRCRRPIAVAEAQEGRPAGRRLRRTGGPGRPARGGGAWRWRSWPMSPSRRCKKILTAGSAKPLVALVWHAHLSMRVAFKIQTFIMKLPAANCCRRAAASAFPLTKEEMRWHLDYFDIAA